MIKRTHRNITWTMIDGKKIKLSKSESIDLYDSLEDVDMSNEDYWSDKDY